MKFFRLSILFLLCLTAPGIQVFSQVGGAGFYSDRFEGKRTASGEIFRQKKLTAAHRSLPFGSKVKVINLRNKKSVIVRINDRGPFVKGRIIDLTTTAAKRIGNLREGVFKVRIKVLKRKRKHRNK